MENRDRPKPGSLFRDAWIAIIGLLIGLWFDVSGLTQGDPAFAWLLGGFIASACLATVLTNDWVRQFGSFRVKFGLWVTSAIPVLVGTIIWLTYPEPEETAIDRFKNAAQPSGFFSMRSSVLDRKQFGDCPNYPCYVVDIDGWSSVGSLRANFTLGGSFPTIQGRKAFSIPVEIGESCWAELRVADMSFRFVVEDAIGPDISVWFGISEGMMDLKGQYAEVATSCELDPRPVVAFADLHQRLCMGDYIADGCDPSDTEYRAALKRQEVNFAINREP